MATDLDHRLSTILDHLKKGHEGVRVLQDLAVVYDMKEALSMPVDKLNQIIVHFIGDMYLGLEGKTSSFKMLPSYVYKGDANVSGTFLALDLGGTNFRVMSLTLDCGKVVQEDQVKYEIPSALMRSDKSGEELFDFIAKCVKEYQEKQVASKAEGLGFTFSFPVLQHGIDSGILITWTKGFSTKGVEGRDVVMLLREAFAREGVKIPVSALVNDTVGTLVAGYFADHHAEVGVILGTGSNACYWEDVPQIRKLPSPSGWLGGDQKMCINIEWGNFDSINQNVLPYTEMDNEIDRQSPNPGRQRFEKLISGMYLGEIARLLILKLVRHGILPTVPTQVPPFSLPSVAISEVLRDESADLAQVRAVFYKLYKYELTTGQATTIRDMFCCITLRSARLAASGIAAILLKTGNVKNAKICVDGSVFEKTPYYKQQMEQCLDEIFESHGITSHGVQLVPTSNGSGVGAAMISALAKRAPTSS
eukprot:TRINITY_DN1373_c0_g4_i2.p1 TRINITY_DN1373_c0_g4~~TRINITY_DN1373_c0_g4_i2.p1  ORF type:complete len:494 (+),score=166.90 TRINITY_DN1373_c0_g4_i2:52-1482(+)